MKRLTTAAVFVLFLFSVNPSFLRAASIDPAKVDGPQLLQRLPKDPLAAWAGTVGNGGELYDSIVALLRRFVPEDAKQEMEQGLASMDEALGFSLRDDFLAYLGPEVAFSVDFPPIDNAVGAVMAGTPEGIAGTIDGLGLWVQITDADKVERALRSIFAKTPAEIIDGDRWVEVRFEVPGQGANPDAPSTFSVYYGFTDGLFALGFSPESVAARLEAPGAGMRLEDGGDFQRVVRHLDSEPQSLVYLNLPKLQHMVGESQVARGMLASNEELQPMMEILLDPDMAQIGAGASWKMVDDGARKVVYGPEWTGSGAFSSGIIAAIAIPNLINALQGGRTKRTMADMRTIGVALGAFAVDNDHYPSTEGWVEVTAVADSISPMYISRLPARDGWDNPYLYWSDGSSFRLVSPGKDGVLDQQWDGPLESRTTTDVNADIVLGDGVFLVYPSITD